MMIFLGLAGVVGLINLVCFVMVLIELFKREGAGKGILGLVCGIYTFFWGWQNASSLDMQAQSQGGSPKYRTIMMVWTACLVGNIILNIVARTMN